MTPKDISDLKKAGKIANEVRKYTRSVAKKNVLLIELAEKIESKIIKLGGKPAFPTNLCINETTAHYTPSYDDTTRAFGLLKIDFGVHINGWITDCALSLDLEGDYENTKLIESADNCLKNAVSAIKDKLSLGEIGGVIQKTAERYNLNSIKNLSGHEINLYDLHAGITIPNYDNNNLKKLDDGIYAIEPFVTQGEGLVYDGKPSGIYKVEKNTSIRDKNAREIFEFIISEYKTLPFCSRWLVKKFGTRALFSINLIEKAGALHQYSQLIEHSKSKVAQAETTILINKGNVEVII